MFNQQNPPPPSKGKKNANKQTHKQKYALSSVIKHCIGVQHAIILKLYINCLTFIYEIVVLRIIVFTILIFIGDVISNVIS